MSNDPQIRTHTVSIYSVKTKIAKKVQNKNIRKKNQKWLRYIVDMHTNHTQTSTHTHAQRHTQRYRHTETGIYVDTDTDTQQKDRQTKRQKRTQSRTQTERQTDRKTDRQTLSSLFQCATCSYQNQKFHSL